MIYGKHAIGRGRRVCLGISLGVCALLTACAVVEAPPGGPKDATPPYLAGSEPDSGAGGLDDVKLLSFTFSEKMNRTSAAGWLTFFPPQEIQKTSWKRARTARIQLRATLPPDTVIIVEIAGGMSDAHKVKGRGSRRFPIATVDSIPDGRVSGTLAMGDSAVTRGVVELYPAGPDSVEFFRRPLLRRTVTDVTGQYDFNWLPETGGPWIMRAFVDSDGNLRLGEREAKRVLPDTVSLTPSASRITLGSTTLFAIDTPGRILFEPFTGAPWPGTVFVWADVVAESDTGWSPSPLRGELGAMDPAAGGVLENVKPGLQRLVMFVDIDGDSLFGSVPDSMLVPFPDSLIAATPAWYWEPWWQVEGPEVEPGLDTHYAWQPGPAGITPGSPPDSTAAAADSASAVTDTLQLVPPGEEF